MLTKRNKENIRNFEKLKEGHKKTFKYRLSKKCLSAQKDIEYILLNNEKLKIKVDKVIDIGKLLELIGLYEETSRLQNL